MVARWLALVAVGLSASTAPGSDESPIPPILQARLLLNVLSFDRALQQEAGEVLVIGVLIQRKYRPSLESGEDMLAAFAAPSVRSWFGGPMNVVAVELGDGADLAAELERLGVDVLYVTPLRALAVAGIAATTRAGHIRSFTAVPDSVREGIAVGLGVRDERPEILVNLRAAQAEGADLSAQLLRMARIIE